MTKLTSNLYRTIYISPPGDTLIDVIEERELTVGDFAISLGESEATIKKIIDGKAEITPEIASKLEKVLDIPASFWSNRERNYREALAKQADRYIPNVFEAITIFAFLEALRRLNNPLSPELKAKIQQLDEILISDTKKALSLLSDLAADNSIKGFYQQVRQEIIQQYQIDDAGNFLSKANEDNIESLCELVATLMDVIDSLNLEQEVREFAPELDELSKRLFNLTLV
jgi:plasmid maintenance system antidote protein VapI